MDIFIELHKNDIGDLKGYIKYKLQCLNENGNYYTEDSFIEGDTILYVYCGHDGVSQIKNVENEERLNKHIEFYESARRYWYFDCVSVVNGIITVH